MAIAIMTKFLGSRVKATHMLSGASVTVSWDHAQDIDENHSAAMLRLLDKLGRGGDERPAMVSASVSGGGRVWVEVTSYNMSGRLAK